MTVGVVFAGILAVLGVLTRARTKPSLCPQCRARTLVPDQHGVVWQCMPCNTRYLRVGANLIPHIKGLLGEERIPTATVHVPDDK
jgi:hypothetical protein